MRNLITSTFILFFITKAFCQSNNISFTVSNNAQLDKVLEFYQPFQYPPFISLYTSNNDNYDNLQKLKFNLHYERGNDSSYFWSFKAGIFLWREVYSNTYRTTYSISNLSQNVYSFSIGWMKSLHVNNFIFSAGLELPYYIIQKYNENYKSYDSYSTEKLENIITVDGGYAIGLNSQISVRYFFSNHFCVRTD